MIWRLLLSGVFAILVTVPAAAMTFEVMKQVSEDSIFDHSVFAKGEISRGDEHRLKNILDDAPGHVALYLSSLGGDIDAAIAMARHIVAHGNVTAIVADKCASACSAILFPAAQYSILRKGALLGFHSCYSAREKIPLPECNEEIAQLAVTNGFPHGTIRSYMDVAGPQQIYWISEISARCWGYYRGFSDPKPIHAEKPCVDATIRFLVAGHDRQIGRGPSFDCDKAATNVERLICDDEELSSIDAFMGELYQFTMKRLSKAQSSRLRNSQRGWIENREVQCAIKSEEIESFKTSRRAANCLSASIQERMMLLLEITRDN